MIRVPGTAIPHQHGIELLRRLLKDSNTQTYTIGNCTEQSFNVAHPENVAESSIETHTERMRHDHLNSAR